MQQAGYEMSQQFSGGMTKAMAGQAFKGVSAMGYEGSDRMGRLNFISSNYKSMGMSVDESMQLIQVASKNLTTSLGDLHTQLQQVRKSAADAGQSAQMMAQSFTQNFALTSGVGGGQGSGALAAGITASSGPGLGRIFAGTSTTGMISTLQQQAITGSYVGLPNPASFMAAGAKNPEVIAKAMDLRLGAMVGGAVPTEIRTKVEAEITRRGGPLVLKGAGGQNVAMAIAKSSGLTNLSSQGLQAIMAAFKIDDPTNDPLQMCALIVNYIGQLMPNSPTSNSAVTAATVQKTKEQVGVQFPTGPTGGGREKANTPGAVNQSSSWVPSGSKSRVPLAFNVVNGQKVKDPIVENLLADTSIKGLLVSTGDGPRVVSPQEAANKYRDQILDGSATIIGGSNSGASVDATYGSDPDAAAKIPSTMQTKDPKGYLFGKNAGAIAGMNLTADQLATVVSKGGGEKGSLKTAKDLQSGKQQTTSAVAGNITLTMGPDLKGWVNAQTNGGVVQQNQTNSPSQNSGVGASNPAK